jgi:hypothetical protein
MDLTEDGTEETGNAIKTDQEKVDGFLDVQEHRKKNLERLSRALSEYESMKKLDDRISDMLELPEFSMISQKNDNNEEM